MNHGEALEAELMAEYGVELEEEIDESSSSLRKLWVYYDQLPPMNRVSREVLFIDKGESIWGSGEAILADLTDAVNYNTYATLQLGSDRKVKQPAPYPRPDYLKKYREKTDTTPKRNRLPGQVTYVPRDKA